MCGVIGVLGHPEAANLTYLGLHSLQHRGQESAGIASSDGHQLYVHREMGLVSEIFNEKNLAQLPGEAAIGHVRYSTAGIPHVRNAQPLAIDYAKGSLAVAHNGNLTNAEVLRSQLESRGSILQSTTDTEVIVHLLAAQSHGSLAERIRLSLEHVKGAFSLVFLSADELIAVRDPSGFRPLALGRMPVPGDAGKTAWVVASETCAFNLIEAEFVRELEPGEVVVIDGNGPRTVARLSRPEPVAEAGRFCVFEYVYFARPDSVLGGRSVAAVRKRLGRALAVEHPVQADLVIPVPDSGTPAAIGYSQEAGIPFDFGLIRSHYVGRTFIEPRQSIRHFGVKLKLSAVASVLAGKRVVVVDDSLVRGTTARKIVKMLRDAGASEVHLRISSPPVIAPCFYGIDTPTRRELIASSHTVEEIARYITCDSIGYVSQAGMMRAVQETDGPAPGAIGGLCSSCFTGHYPVGLTPPEHSEDGDGDERPDAYLREGRIAMLS